MQERKLTKPEAKAKERIVKDLKGAKADFKKRYGDDAEAVMYATATKRAKKVAENSCDCGCGDSEINHTINELIEDLVYEELCKRGKAYIAARKRAGEKSSAYLSGRAVKVCKGQMKGAGGKRKKSYRKKKRKRRTNEALYQQLRTQTLRYLEETFFNDPYFAIIAEYENINEVTRRPVPITINGKTYSSMFNYGAKKALAKLSPEERDKVKMDAFKAYDEKNATPVFKNQKEKEEFFDQFDDIDLGNPVDESLRNWFKKEDWVRIDTQGNIAGKCGTMPKGKATQRCLPRAKANSLTKAQRRATARKKVRGSKKGKQFVKNTKKAKVSFKKK
jgi:hypothetical protein